MKELHIEPGMRVRFKMRFFANERIEEGEVCEIRNGKLCVQCGSMVVLIEPACVLEVLSDLSA